MVNIISWLAKCTALDVDIIKCENVANHSMILQLPPYSPPLNDDTKILTETDTKTFFYDTKFSETETKTFFRDQIFPKPKPRLFYETKFFETETETLKNLAKVSRPRPKPRLLNTF